MWKQLLQRSARDNLTLQGQIREMLVSAILDGQLKPDAPVPSSRELATELVVGRITVVLTYQQLADEGYLVSRERKGHFVSSALLGQRMQSRTPAEAVWKRLWSSSMLNAHKEQENDHHRPDEVNVRRHTEHGFCDVAGDALLHQQSTECCGGEQDGQHSPSDPGGGAQGHFERSPAQLAVHKLPDAKRIKNRNNR
jgi:DNA-binding transcriptional regulator YhcF (GntR family)